MNSHALLTLGNWGVTPHLLLMGLGVLLCLAFAFYSLKKAGTHGKTARLFIALAVPLAFIFARLGHALVYLADTLDDPASLLELGEDKFLLLGAGLGLMLVMLLAARFGRTSFGKLADVLAPIFALMMAWSRLLEGLVGLGYSLDILNPSLQFFPLGIYDDYWETWAYALFVLEALYALFIALCLYRIRSFYKGDRFIVLVFLYAVLQIWFESLRRDAYARIGFIRVNQLLCALLVGGIVLYWLLRSRRGLGYVLTRFVPLLALAGVVMEFAVEYKIGFLLELNQRWQLSQSQHYLFTYGIMLLAVLGMMTLGLIARRKGLIR